MSYRLETRGVLRLSDSLIITSDMPAWQEYRAWLKAGGVPEPMPAPAVAPPTLAEVKRTRAQAITGEALDRIQEVLPEVANMATAMLIRELWLSVAPAARQPTGKMASVISIYQIWGAAIAEIKACNSASCVTSVEVIWP